jgi:hypothetical protein
MSSFLILDRCYDHREYAICKSRRPICSHPFTHSVLPKHGRLPGPDRPSQEDVAHLIPGVKVHYLLG